MNIIENVTRLTKIEAAAREFFPGRKSLGSLSARSPYVILELALAVFGPGPKPSCPTPKTDTLGNKCDGNGAGLGSTYSAYYTWYCPVHGQRGPNVDVDYIVAQAQKAAQEG